MVTKPRPGTRSKSRRFVVAMSMPWLKAVAAIQRSWAPIDLPSASSAAQISACARATEAVIGNGSTAEIRCSTNAERRALKGPSGARWTPCRSSLTVITLIARSSSPTERSKECPRRSASMRTEVSIRTATRHLAGRSPPSRPQHHGRSPHRQRGRSPSALAIAQPKPAASTRPASSAQLVRRYGRPRSPHRHRSG